MSQKRNMEDKSAQLNAILAASAVGIGVVKDRFFVEVNPYLCMMLGYEMHELIGNSARMVYISDEEFQNAGKIKYARIEKDGKGSVETRWLTKTGDVIDILISSVPIDSTDLSKGVVFTAYDLTEKKQADRDLKFLSEFERLITGISTRFINLPAKDLEKTLDSALLEICEFTKMDRGFILLFSDDQSVMRHLCMFTRKDDPGAGYDMPSIPTEKMQWWINILRRNETYRMTSLDDIPKKERYLREIRVAAGIKSQLDVPVMQQGILIGSIGLVSTKKEYSFPDQYAGLIRVFAEIVSNALERKRMEEALVTSINRSANLIKTSPMGILIYQLDQQDQLILIDANPSTTAILGADYRNSIGQKLQDVFPNLANTLIPESYKKVALTGKDWSSSNFTYKDDHIAGAYDIIAFQIAPRQVAVMFSDITERKQTEQKLQQSEEKHRKIFQNIQDVYFEMSVETIILEVSPSVSRISGYTREKLIGQSLEKLGIDVNFKNAFMELLIHKGELLDYDVPLRDIDGREVYCSVNVKLEKNSMGEPVKVIGSLRDISERKMAREKISKLERAVEQSPSSVVITDLEGKIDYVNPKFCEVTGYSKKEVMGKNPRIMKSGDQEPEYYKELWDTISSGMEWRGEFHNKKKDGTTFWEMASISPVRNHLDEITHYIAIKEDITERKKWEHELQEAKLKAEESDRLKSAFLANMSHEIRTPMNAILGFSELLKSNDIPEPDKLEYIKLINTKGNDLMMIISDLIDISRIESGDMKLAITDIRVNDLVTEVFEQTLKEKDFRGKDLVQIRKNISENIQPIIQSDKNRLRQVFTNLMSNALKFTQEGYIEIGYRYSAKIVQFFVKDTGIGISEDKQEIIFERFRQADDSYTRKYGGTGLGLAISKQIVELLKGKISVESIPGQGSTFWFSIPLKEIESIQTGLPEMQEVYSQKVLDLENRTILIAEDDPSNYLFLESLLRPSGAELIWARDGNKAVEFHQNNKAIDIILMDIRMPSLNGLLATKKIRTRDKDIPIIALTAFAFQDDRIKSKDAGCNEHLTKPVKIDELKSVLLKYLT